MGPLGLLELTGGSGCRIVSVAPSHGKVRLRLDDAAVVVRFPCDKRKEHGTMAGHRQGRQQKGKGGFLAKNQGSKWKPPGTR